MEGGEGWVGVGREEAKAPQVNARGPELPTDGPDQTTRLKNSRPITPNWCAPQVSMCQSCFYKAVNPPLRKADHLSLVIRDMLCG